MARRHREHPVEYAQLAPLQLGDRGRLVGCADQEVGPAVGQRLPGAPQHLVGDAQRHAGLQRVEVADQRQQRVELHQLVGDDPEPVLPAARDLPHPARQPRDVLLQPRRFQGQQLPGRRELEPIAAAVEQQRVEALLELPRRMRHRRRRLAEPCRRAREAAGVADRLQQAQLLLRQHAAAPLVPRRGHRSGKRSTNPNESVDATGRQAGPASRP